MSEYPQDEFDELGATGPSGAHRAVRPRWRTYLPFILVIVLAPLASWGVVWLMHDTGRLPQEKASVSQSQKAAPKADVQKQAEAEAKKAEAEKAAAAEQAAKETNAKLAVQVLNVNAPSGSAGNAAKILQELGFTQAKAADAPAAVVPGSMVFYKSEADRSAADEIAKKLGIKSVEMAPEVVGTDNIRVYLKNDYAPPQQ